jgi:branched-chain amino acid transport system permease protein
MQQLIANALFSACIYALVGVGFSLVYKCGRFFHFAHGAIITLGAYSSLVFAEYLGLPLPLAIPCGIMLATTAGCIMDFSVYRPLRLIGSTPLGLLLASLGLYIVVQNAISLIFGNETKTLLPGVVFEGIRVFGTSITIVQFAILTVSTVAIVVLSAALQFTRLGKMMRAVSSDAELARAMGVNVQRVMLWAMGIGSCLAATAGMLVALDVNMIPTLGMRILLMSIVAVVIGGAGRQPGILGVAAGAGLVGLLQDLGVWKLPTQWQDTIIFGCLIFFLLVRPEGLIAKTVRRA